MPKLFNQAALLSFLFLLLVFAMQYLFLRAGNVSSRLSCLISRCLPSAEPCFYPVRLMLLSRLSILTAQPGPHWLISQILSALIAASRCHSTPPIIQWTNGLPPLPAGWESLLRFGVLPTQTCWHTLLPGDKGVSPGTHPPIEELLSRFK